MRFSKAPLIATLMAVALSLLIILPALAENTNGEVTQGRGTDNELIVGVYDPTKIEPECEIPVMWIWRRWQRLTTCRIHPAGQIDDRR